MLPAIDNAACSKGEGSSRCEKQQVQQAADGHAAAPQALGGKCCLRLTTRRAAKSQRQQHMKQAAAGHAAAPQAPGGRCCLRSQFSKRGVAMVKAAADVTSSRCNKRQTAMPQHLRC
jgi:hypothetical protein